MDKKYIVHSSSSEKTLYFKSLTGTEKLFSPYKFEIQLLSEKRLSNPISLHNTNLTIEIKNESTSPRYLSGYIEEISYSPFHKYDDRLYLYTAIVRPNLWNLKKLLGYGIWQDKTVPDIITEILNNAGISFKNQLIEKYRTWEYCVKHNETDFDFIHRLMEHEGIYYYFKHDMGSHTMILVDAPQSHESVPSYDKIKYINTMDTVKKRPTEYIYDWNVSSITIPHTYSLDDYDFRKPRAKLYTATQTQNSSIDDSNVFIWPGHYTKSEQGQFYSRVRQQASEAKSELVDGKGNVLGMAPGHIFTLELPHDIKGDEHSNYLVIGTHYALYDDIYPSDSVDTLTDDSSASDQNKNIIRFDAIPASTPWKPSAITPWPKVMGLETATVAGPKDKKIWTDKYGRIKVKFRWDRDDKQDDSRSCWIRVATQWAGWRYGSVCIPRVGEEVIISFVNGDPDKPLVIGSTYNDENMPPWELPQYEARIGIMSNTEGGKHDQASYLFLDDKPDKESFTMHAERDMSISVEKNKDVIIHGESHTQVNENQKNTVGGNAEFTYQKDHSVTINGKDTLTAKSSRQETIDGGLKTKIKGGRKTEIKGKDSLTLKNGRKETISDGGLETKIKGGRKTEIEGEDSLTLKNGRKETISDGGLKTDIKGGRKTEIDGGDTCNVKGNSDTKVTGNWTQEATGMVTLKSSGIFSVSAALYKID
ncbi:type VI secretion system tip protein VgrG [Xenorhabdus sp. 12]|uniref:Type VI secretion system tip protein VgrG n=1 Tax=Xenorhabdus santafensis TaxID=2582833 RepID=A0ABU4SCI4_9GAMM|nr:type VI secretion system tip protein TssI/VgrG [Xenorhabdus sp. 12]MDX7988498.1 type VI secretion system tip protein VgrG [Xenorhabdus sp. 12]